MQNIIQVTVNEQQEPLVSGRQLHEALGVNSRYTTRQADPSVFHSSRKGFQ